jgi:hypothetical protein
MTIYNEFDAFAAAWLSCGERVTRSSSRRRRSSSGQ